ncbi:MAG TPA: P44/Msp2 family outer membrane protein [Legionellaceae bacterium]|nr:P44/Msp2 family outer membrane protein [Legionellaceae bacterium]
MTFVLNNTSAANLGPGMKEALDENTNSTDHTGKLTYSVLGGIGGQIGYRFCDKFRFEIEALYNNNPFNQLKFENFEINSVSTSPYFHIGGDTNTGAGMFNFYYDLLTHNNDGYSAISPHIGVGVGYAYVQNSLQFHYGYDAAAAAAGTPATMYEIDFTKQYSTYAGQVILGVSYFMDDFCWLSADARYWTTGTLKTNIPLIDQQFQRKEQLYSFMIGFNGILNFG